MHRSLSVSHQPHPQRRECSVASSGQRPQIHASPASAGMLQIILCRNDSSGCSSRKCGNPPNVVQYRPMVPLRSRRCGGAPISELAKCVPTSSIPHQRECTRRFRVGQLIREMPRESGDAPTASRSATWPAAPIPHERECTGTGCMVEGNRESEHADAVNHQR